MHEDYGASHVCKNGHGASNIYIYIYICMKDYEHLMYAWLFTEHLVYPWIFREHLIYARIFMDHLISVRDFELHDPVHTPLDKWQVQNSGTARVKFWHDKAEMTPWKNDSVYTKHCGTTRLNWHGAHGTLGTAKRIDTVETAGAWAGASRHGPTRLL